jgi:hypothetical protein
MDDNHRRALRSSLLVVERDLHYVRNQLESDASRSASYFTRNDVSPETRRKVLAMTQIMLDEVERIMKKFDLESKEESVRRNILGVLSEVWTILEETRPERLKAYGSLSEREAELLVPHVQKLRRILDDIFQVLR